MTLKDDRDSDWRPLARQGIGRALLAAGPGGLAARELAEATGKDPSNVRRTARAMADADLLTVGKPAQPEGGRGRPSTAAYRLAAGERERLEAILETGGGLGILGPGLQIVIADAAGARLADLQEVIAEPEAAPQLAWSAIVDGQPQEYLLAFEGPVAASAATKLVTVLTKAGIPSRRASVAGVTAGHRFLAEAREASSAAARVAIRQATRRAATG